MQGENLCSAVLKWQRKRVTADAERALQRRWQIPLQPPATKCRPKGPARQARGLPLAGQSGFKAALRPGLSPANSDFQPGAPRAEPALSGSSSQGRPEPTCSSSYPSLGFDLQELTGLLAFHFIASPVSSWSVKCLRL